MKPILSIALLWCTISLSAQNFKITGSIQDTLDNPLLVASVMLLDKDSTLLEFTQTDMEGRFQFRKIASGSYLIKSTYVGYIPVTQSISSQGEDIKLPPIKMEEIAEALMEVVIKAARAPMKIRGDTIEYDATTFKVPEGSSVEDLLKRLPGVEIDQDGSIKADGMDVTKVTVEGKSFFGGDPKAATKNLPAEGVSKIQVFDKKSEEEKLTGIKGNSDEKEMNISLKDDYKKGGFGKVIVGGGSEERGEIKGNYNRFNTKHQFSLVGVGNNTGRNGLGWDDYQDFMGSQAFSFEGNNLEYGFGGNGMRFYSFGGSGGNELESKISNSFFSGNNGGFPQNVNTGINYNYDHKKTQVGSRYFYNHNGNQNDTRSNETTFLEDFTTFNTRNSQQESAFDGHRGELSLTQEIDSMHTVVISADLASVISKRDNNAANLILRDNDVLTSESDISNDYRLGGSLLNTTAILRKSFKKKGRFFGANVSYLTTKVDETNKLNSTILFYNDQQEIDSTNALDQNNVEVADKQSLKFNLTFSEPLSKKFFWSTFYNNSRRKQDGDINVTDRLENTETLNEQLSRTYTNQVGYQRGGTTITYAHDGLNISVGGGYQEFSLKGDYQGKGNSTLNGTVDRTFGAWIPYANLSYSMGRSGRFGVSYSKGVTEPTIENLLPIVDNSNPLYITEGNPDLLPTSSQAVRFNFSKSNSLSGVRFYINGGFTWFDNQTISDQTVDENLVTYVRKINYEGGNRINSYLGFNFPIKKNKVKANINSSFSLTKGFSLVNEVLNTTNTLNIRPSLGLDITPNDNVSIYLDAYFGRTNTGYSVSASQNQKISNDGLSAEVNLKVAKGLYFASSYNHTFFSNERFGQNQDVPIINASIYKQFLKGNKGEIRLSAYDVLNKNVRFSQFAGDNRVSQTSTASLARYFMLSFTYNIRGLKSGINKNGYY